MLQNHAKIRATLHVSINNMITQLQDGLPSSPNWMSHVIIAPSWALNMLWGSDFAAFVSSKLNDLICVECVF